MKHRHYAILHYFCKTCRNSSDIAIEVESPSDYYLLEYECAHCGEPILETDDIAKMVYNAVVDYYAGRSDYLKDR